MTHLAVLARDSTPTLRPPRAGDADRIGRICFQAFKAIAEKHRFPPDFPTAEAAIDLMAALIARPDIHGFIAELDGRVVGSNFLWKDGGVAGIGPITVEPDVQNGDVGRRLMEAVLERARMGGIAAVRLVQAAYHNRSLALYTKLGFAAREPLSLLRGPALALGLDGRSVRSVTEADLEAANTLCRRIHGFERASSLREAVLRGSATLVEHEGRITGYATEIGFFGHAVGETTEDLKALIGAAKGFSGPGFMVPTRDAALLRWCLEHGLRIVQPMTLMSLGPYTEPRGAFLPSILY